jgi:hypothetical protein
MELFLIVSDECRPINQRHTMTVWEMPLYIFVCCVDLRFCRFQICHDCGNRVIVDQESP